MALGLPLLLLAEVALELPLDLCIDELQEGLLIETVVEIVTIMLSWLVPGPSLPRVAAYIVDLLLKVANVGALIACEQSVSASLHVDLNPVLILNGLVLLLQGFTTTAAPRLVTELYTIAGVEGALLLLDALRTGPAFALLTPTVLSLGTCLLLH